MLQWTAEGALPFLSNFSFFAPKQLGNDLSPKNHHWFYMLNWPKSLEQGPSSAYDVGHTPSCGLESVTLTDCPVNVWLLSCALKSLVLFDISKYFFKKIGASSLYLFWCLSTDKG